VPRYPHTGGTRGKLPGACRPDQLEAYRLHTTDGIEASQLATMFAVTEGTIRNWLRAARQEVIGK
jgi:DNA-directed RNA polymerase specialized sigma24 family protein